MNKYYRVTYDEIGIYEALKKELFKKSNNPKKEWNDLKNSICFSWLKVPTRYNENCYSYFTEQGINNFKKYSYNEFLKYLDKNKIIIKEYYLDNNKIIYKDENQIVIENNVYDEIMNIMNNIKYGYLDLNGNKHENADNDFANLYRLSNPNETLNNKIGVCWDQVELERYLFNKKNIECKTFFIIYYGDICPTHTFLTYIDNNKYYWFEHSWEKHKGIHKYNNEYEALKDIKEKFIKYELNNKCDNENICIFEYVKPEYGINVLDFMNYCEKGKKIKI